MKFRSNYSTGIYQNLAEPVYRADKALSTSELKKFKVTPKAFHAYRNKLFTERRSPSMEKGTLFHLYALERSRFDDEVSVCPPEFEDRRKKASKEYWAEQEEKGVQVIKQDDLRSIQMMFAAYSELSEVREAHIRNPQSEVSVFCEDFVKGLDVKCRVDLLIGDTVIDIKTTAKGGANPRAFLRKCRDLGYDWQQYNYTRILQKAGVEVRKWVWAVVETEPPFDASQLILAEADVAEAETEVVAAYRQLMSCVKLDAWPSYTPSKAAIISRFNSTSQGVAKS